MAPTTITRDLMKEIRVSLDEAIAAIATRHGVAIQIGRGSFSPQNAAFKVEVALIAADGTTLTPEAVTFQSVAPALWGFTPDQLGARFTFKGDLYEITGAKPGTKFPIFGNRVRDGKGFKFPAETVKACLVKSA